MSRCALVLLTWAACLPAHASDSSDQPIQLKVLTRRAVVRCGPGVEYYGTVSLDRGDQVHAYRRDPGGWFGIRPPEGSHSWVRAEDVLLTGNARVATVAVDDAVAWIGSDADDVKEHRWQIRLKRGESLALSGRASFTAFPGDQSEEYFRVAPPAGEYRWIHAHDVESIDEAAVSAEPIQLTDFQVDADERSNSQRSAVVFVPRSSPRSHKLSSRFASRTDVFESEPRSSADAEKFEDRVRDLDLRLALIVSKSPGTWELNELRTEADRLATTATTTLQRARSEIVLDRLQQYESLQRRYAGLGDGLTPGPQRPQEDRRPREDRLAATDEFEGPAIDPRFDGQGWLLPVHSSKRESPPYALLDNEGQILQFVSPAPGINLHRYLRKEVGVFGQRDPEQTLNKPHLTAHRIVDIDRHRR